MQRFELGPLISTGVRTLLNLRTLKESVGIFKHALILLYSRTTPCELEIIAIISGKTENFEVVVDQRFKERFSFVSNLTTLVKLMPH